ncbi:MAG TPA: alpha/beta fold hydrolase [Novosphingobium sp.]|nr:alpha/beta fold hydrolase [Novosphingobium sp.]
MTIPDTTATFEAGDLALDSGEVLPDARVVYRVIGQPDAERANCILLPTYYTGSHRSYDAMIGPGRALDPARWCIVIASMFGNGWSTSPSHRGDGPPFAAVSIADNVRAQELLLREELGITRLALAAGWSMGAMQAIGWAALFPDRVERLLAWCGAAR